MDHRNLDKAMEIFACLITGETVGKDNHRDLYDAYSSQAVSDGDRCTVSGEFLQTVLDPSLTFVVQGTCCFIKNKNRRIFQEDPGNGNTLLLATGKSGTTFTDKGRIYTASMRFISCLSYVSFWQWFISYGSIPIWDI